jgi:hypothetical protein
MVVCLQQKEGLCLKLLETTLVVELLPMLCYLKYVLPKSALAQFCMLWARDVTL